MPKQEECTETAKRGENSEFIVDEKKSSEILAEENLKKILGKGQIGKIFHGV